MTKHLDLRGAIGTPEKSALSQNSCFYLLPHKILNIDIILYLLRLIARLNVDY
jgi:hypothetical protein